LIRLVKPYRDDEEEADSRDQREGDEETASRGNRRLVRPDDRLLVILAIGLFFVVPVGLTSLIKGQLGSPFLFWLGRGSAAHQHLHRLHLGDQPDVGPTAHLRVQAPSTNISCYEAEDELTPERAKLTPLHPRLRHQLPVIVMVLAIFIFAPLGTARLVLAGGLRGSSASR